MCCILASEGRTDGPDGPLAGTRVRNTSRRLMNGVTRIRPATLCLEYEGVAVVGGLAQGFSLNGPHPGGGTQDTDFNQGFTEGMFTNFCDLFCKVSGSKTKVFGR